ncbi:MAG: type II toxin-antitoxin system PemK/MazF family toxin [Coriobacteriales bacterium]|jgi:mRNA interferase MazF|nr:type II toxin-antitoxin system PemK/MazF family toxin [Coriobacteriales bacterium]
MSGYRQGELIEVNFSPSRGHEPLKTRPAVVVSADAHNAMSSLVCVCPITSLDNGYPLHVKLPKGSYAHGAICVEQLRSVDLVARGAISSGEFLDEDTMDQILERVGAIFSI